MVKTTGVRGSTLARLAMVLVLLSIGNTPALRITPALRVIGNAPPLRVTPALRVNNGNER